MSHFFSSTIPSLWRANNKFELIDSLVKYLKTLGYDEDSKVDAMRRRAEMIIRKIFGESS